MQKRPLKLFLVRHGETELNARNVVQGGGIDAGLNEVGKLQANAFYEYYKKTEFVGLYCSTLLRTYQTLMPFIENGSTIRRFKELNELGWGKIEGEAVRGPAYHTLRAANLNWDAGNFDYAPPGGETPIQARNRSLSVLKAIIHTHYATGGNVLICTHGRLLRVILSNLLGYGMQYMQLFRHANTGLNILTYTKPDLKPDIVYAECLNDLRHLQHANLQPTTIH